MLFFPKFNSTKENFYYDQLYEHIKSEIISGKIAKGTHLPSIRKLSDFLSISTTPVETAYQQLLAEGFIESRPRKGYFVQEVPHVPLSPRMESDEAASTIQFPIEGKQSYSYDFHISKNDFSYFPMRIWRRLLNQVLQNEYRNLLFYGDAQGEMGLRNEVATYLNHFRGVVCSPEQIVIGAEQQQLVSLICLMLKTQINKVGAENPGYQLIPGTFKSHGFHVTPIQVNEDGICIESLYETGVQLINVTPSHQFPLGMTMPVSTRFQLLEWARKVNGYIIEDDYDGEFCYRNKPVPALQGLSPDANVFYLGGFSQALMPDICIHYLVLPPSLVDTYYQLRSQLFMEQSSSRVFQRTLQLFMEQGHFERHIRKMRNIYQKKHDCLIQSIETYMGSRVQVIGKNAGFYILLQVHSDKSERELLQRAIDSGIRISSTSFTWLNTKETDSKEFLIGFSGIELEKIEEGIKVLSEAWFG
ncbi:PLP-dependent aminotransferase family protein [Bacillus sp. S/N-304-OC-R1]|uniref:MocR-like pyridoxine biosynthesis transcription factor PdxR n=1 Tax=Bacillus sp. S/N-304-OC-R1 TaxID=2758034 RepID=UPI001C8EBB98|nr:PLP-dependent aminotransferase family protein [Bacillus sp. S/N-304-OC-R1]MBY0122785.1 PLP-dependent aminotransferase family protein [Bacillus sp. S/N-304-OC-R1]